MAYFVDQDREDHLTINVFPDRGGFVLMEVVAAGYTRRHYYDPSKRVYRYKVRLADSTSFFSSHTTFRAAARAAIKRAQQFDGERALT